MIHRLIVSSSLGSVFLQNSDNHLFNTTEKAMIQILRATKTSNLIIHTSLWLGQNLFSKGKKYPNSILMATELPEFVKRHFCNNSHPKAARADILTF
jgi:hypothetical protein